MNGDEWSEVETELRRRPGRWWFVALGLLVAAAILIGFIWTQRRQIAGDYIADELARRGVRGNYEVAEIGFRTQRLENLVIGDPARPDATARSVEIEISLGLRRPRVELITARGVKMRGRIVDGKVSLGEIDKLLPPPTGAPFRFPNQDIDIADAWIALATPAGRVGLSVEGRGNLAESFQGRIAAASSGLTTGGCAVSDLRAFGDVAVTGRRPRFEGPVQASRIACENAGLVAERPRLALDVTVPERFDSWLGDARFSAGAVRYAENSAGPVAGEVGFTGNGEQTRGEISLQARRVAAGGGFSLARGSIDGNYAFVPRTGAVSLRGDLDFAGLDASSAADPAAAPLAAAAGTPIEPVAAGLANAVRGAGRGIDGRAAVRLVNAPGYGALRIDELSASSASGARVALAGGRGFTYYWPAGRSRIIGELALTGGGLPATRLSLRQAKPGGAIEGEARVAPLASGSARLAIAPIRFSAGGGGETRISTVATVSGPFNDGRVDGLVVPIAGRFARGGFTLGESCTPVSFQSLQAAGLRIGPTRLPLCPEGPGLLWRRPGGVIMAAAQIAQPRLAGRIGGTDLAVAASRARFTLAEPGFSASDVDVALGPHRLALATLAGRFTPRGVTGSFAGADAKLANVPLFVEQGRGDWSVLGGDLLLTSALRVRDEVDPERFYPLTSDDFQLTLDGSRIDATASLDDPESGTLVTNVVIAHNLSAGAGRAMLNVPGITFTEDYQPEELTRLTTGVVALVAGTVTGRGEIAWNPEGTTSTGSFSTQDMNLAATFGPVEGLTTTIEFTDLLGLATAPGQVATVDLIRAGIDVLDGRVRYQLLPGLQVRVEEGRWPFAGGELHLAETILDFSKPSPKRLTFNVVGIDAAAFVQRFEFNNIAATGTFDGVLPMIFDEGGGRIVGGRLNARPEGGTLSYIGELTDKQLGAYGKLAFDALKSLRYDRLDIALEGALDGEFDTRIDLDGIATNTEVGGGIAGLVVRRLAALPFEFNISIRGPFRALLATAGSLEDPTLLIQNVLPEILQDQPTTTIVQPQESEIVQ